MWWIEFHFPEHSKINRESKSHQEFTKTFIKFNTGPQPDHEHSECSSFQCGCIYVYNALLYMYNMYV